MARYCPLLFMLTCALGAGSVNAASAQTLQDLFRSGNAALASGDEARALQLYGQIVAANVDDADVYYNMAVSQAKSGDLPRAIQYFERALRVRPGDSGALVGLSKTEDALARSRAEKEGEASIDRDLSLASGLLRPFSLRGLGWTLCALNLLFFLSLLLWLWLPRGKIRRNVRISVSMFLGAWLLVSAAGFLIKNGAFSDGVPAIVLDNSALTEAPDVQSETRAQAHTGDRASVLLRDGGYRFIELRNGQKGWIKSENIGTY